MPQLVEERSPITPAKAKWIRETLELTMEEMADKLGLRHRSQVLHLETGRTAITGAKLVLLEQLLHQAERKAGKKCRK